MATQTSLPQENNPDEFESLDLRQLWRRLVQGAAQIIGLGLLGLVSAILIFLIGSPFQDVSTTTNVVFSFPGFEKGQYPDQSKFQPDDLRAPGVIATAIARQGVDNSTDLQSRIRGALSIEGIITPDVTKERERLRAQGQQLPPYIADEYAVSLTLPRKFKLGMRERGLLLNEVISVYKENFQGTYSSVPAAFGGVFETLHNSDFADYELILTKEIQSITDYLVRQRNRAPSFRSVSTNLSFGDLLEQTELFTQVSLDGTLGQIYFHGMSRDRQAALAKMDYYLHTLDGQENRAISEEKVIQDLLAQSQERQANYVLGIKSASTQPRSETPILDQGLIDSLLANDANSFLVRKALDAGLKVKDVQAEKFQLLERRKRMETFMKDGLPSADQASDWSKVENSLLGLQKQYDVLISNITRTNADFGHQEYGDAVRITKSVETKGAASGLALSALLGLSLGILSGAGLSLLGIHIQALKRSA
jgi:hypothetical protein